ncbi:MAG: hypothetical protein IPM64_08620 [Phycisphaerales bacterium]|nr:hypothetical protein [Phycisphaerales bacterium]
MNRLFHIAAIPAIATLLATGGFLAFLFATGRLDAERVALIGSVLRGELDNRLADGQSGEAAPSSAPASMTAPAASAEEIRRTRVAEQIQRATLERAAADIAARQNLLNLALQNLIQMQEDFEKSKENWRDQQRKLSDAVRDEGFKRELQYVERLNPKMAKEHVLRTWRKQKADAVRIFVALPPAKGQRILEQFTSPEDVGVMHELLEQLRLAGANEYAEGSGRTAGDAQP